MKRLAFASAFLPVAFAVGCMSTASPSPTPPGALGVDERGAYTEEAMIWGEMVSTPQLHEVRKKFGKGAGLNYGDSNWQYERTDLRVTTPNSRWVFIGPPQLKCEEGGEGSFIWNCLDRDGALKVDLPNPTDIRAHVITSSHSMKLRIGALARFYP